jgi:GDP/UDP-N,N'-diacetylbacillosamine 2-epimerase (hydrolysing)
MIKKICVISGSRADYDLLKPIMRCIYEDPQLTLQFIVTGAHLSPEFGSNYKIIECDKFSVDWNLEILMSSDTPTGTAKSIGLGLIGFAEAFSKLSPDLIIVLGDRYEIFAAVSAALIFKIPVAHIHGGEITVGSFDESLRHSISKMSHLHFVSTESYYKRVIQLGENPKNVFYVGALGVENSKQYKLLSKQKVEKLLSFEFAEKNLLVTFHPSTSSNGSNLKDIKELLLSLGSLKTTNLFFTLPNADPESRIIINEISKFCEKNSNAKAYASMGQLLYFSCIKYVDAVIGNSSSAIIEVPSFKKPSINIGDRQHGRVQAKSIVNCLPERSSINSAIQLIYSKEFQLILKHLKNPYDNGDTSKKILKIIKKQKLTNITKKYFYDIPFETKI